ncbi:MAG: hypothetical protein A2451_14470 [Bdellovibrionales bacterium RIFOXYC2_FULL_39_8]|nr:MAG: hypothetical protein A2404_02390 [Bdellovibrionales bacterium RIFOXYC1_FULL_39_130]OFZ71473.1 MAG: hypothetical protein A2451_14470 [Bdellovibrionales bacterium RIFOXYC2_FULL_39_8]OFZ75168.1 MAG: hypothetical protein A2560_03350 [Bdellovibrionales bacterium RIFOXYD1_FULL_39_84]
MPLSDRASRNNGDERRPSQYGEVKATEIGSNNDLLLRGPRAWHVDTANIGTWENLKGCSSMQNYEIKKDNFKKSINAPKVVRLIHSSVEVE